jgi:hypothetical protein
MKLIDIKRRAQPFLTRGATAWTPAQWLARDIEQLVPIVEAALDILVALPGCCAGRCRAVGTKIDGLGQVWCDVHGLELVHARDVPAAEEIRKLVRLTKEI